MKLCVFSGLVKIIYVIAGTYIDSCVCVPCMCVPYVCTSAVYVCVPVQCMCVPYVYALEREEGSGLAIMISEE